MPTIKVNLDCFYFADGFYYALPGRRTTLYDDNYFDMRPALTYRIIDCEKALIMRDFFCLKNLFTENRRLRYKQHSSRWRKIVRHLLMCVFMLFYCSAAAVATGAEFAIVGSVSAPGQEAMEGVVVIAQKQGSSILTAVTTNSSGYYAFPSDRLTAGEYTLRIRAAGYELAGPSHITIKVVDDSAAALDLKLKNVSTASELAGQLTSLEWVQSFPGTQADKDLLVRNMVNCGFCHSLERVARSTHDKEGFLRVIQRMKTYETDHSSAVRIQLVAPPEPTEGLQWYGRDAADLAEYLASVNLSGNRSEWGYPLKTLPRPSGEGTRAIVTVFPIPRQPSVIHDLDVDAAGNVWYGNTGWDFIGKLNPLSGEFSEWEAPNFLPPAAVGVDRIVGVQDVQVDANNHIWVGIGGNKHAAFMPESERWKIYDLPVIWKNPFLGPVRKGASSLWATGITEPPEGAVRHEHAFRLDIDTGKLDPGIMLFDDRPSPESPHHDNQLNYCYMMDQDIAGNFLCTAPEPSAIARADAHGKVRLIPTPTPYAYPRRGYRDDKNRFWFSEFFADNVGVIDLNTDKIKEYPLTPRYISPYYTRADRNGDIWISSTGSDRLLKLDPETGEVVKFLMPVSYDARKVVIDDNADRITIWLPNKNQAQLIRVEIPD